jgi:hypothetical protein
MNKESRQPPDTGDPNTTPFVRFDMGALYPSTDIHGAAETVLKVYGTRPTAEVFKELVREGPVGGQYGVLRESTWFAVLQNFLIYNEAGATGVKDAEARCIEALSIMVHRPHEEAWPPLREYIIQNADDLSGWNASFKKLLAEKRDVFRGDDGNYYYVDGADQLVQIIGAKTTEETRLDYITDQLVFARGFLHQFVALFSLFAIADDFARNPGHYHRWIKASLPDPRYHGIGASWNFMHFDYSRTYRWRPSSNLCDPHWLVGDVLGQLTDTLELDHWMKHRDETKAEQEWLEDGCKFQMDYVVETALHIGIESCVYIRFEGKVIRWINGTPERDAVASISIKDIRDHKDEDEKLNRFFTLLAWDHRQPVRTTFGVGGGRSPYPKVYSPRKAAGLLVDSTYLLPLSGKVRDKRQWLALALYREATNSSSTFYEFFCHWRILDLAIPGPADKQAWLEAVAIPKVGHQERLKEILVKHPYLEEYLRKVQLNAIKHVLCRELNPDNPEDLLAITKDSYVMEDIARLVMTDKLNL